MAARHSSADAGFRPEKGTGRRPARASRTQSIALVAVLLLVAAAATVASYVVKPPKARAFDLYYGTILLNDNVAPVSVDLASGRPTVRLIDAAAEVDAKPSANLAIVPLAQGSLLLNSATGEFNIVDPTGFVVKQSSGGVTLPPFPHSHAVGVASGDSAYILQSDGNATHVWLINQSTIAAAMNGTGRSTPRASVILGGGTSNFPGAAVSADGSLWLLSGASMHTLRQLTVPAGSDANAQLQVTQRGSAGNVAALATATANPDGTGADYVALASPESLRIFAPDGTNRTLRVDAPAGTDQILPVTNGEGRFSFLFRSPTGWAVVTAAPTGRADVHRIATLPDGAALAVPAESSGAIFTMSTAAPGNLWRITRDGRAAPVAGMPTYPIVGGESVKLADSEVIARGSRVIFNSRLNYEAVAVFANDSHAPVVIDKRTAVDLNASGGIAALAAQHGTAPHQKPAPSEKPKPAEPVNDKIDCKTISQLPHKPVVQLTQRAARSVQLLWQYPRLSPQDCIPSTYAIDVTQIGSGGPKPPGRLTVQGQNGVNITGLFPNTKYTIVVTAYINNLGTPSDPLRVATSPEGPPAPTGVHTTVDDHGNWTVTWNSCGGLTPDCVPTVSWQIVPTFCDGLGLASPPPNGTLVGDPTAHTFSYTLAGGTALLGRALSFQVQGVGETGLIGTGAGDKTCTRSWGHPDLADLTLITGLQSGTVASGGTTTATGTLKFAHDQDSDSGGVGATYTFKLLGSDGSVLDTVGPGAATTAKFDGIEPGVTYRESVTVTPPGHPEAAVTVGPVPVDHVTSAWPTISAVATAPSASPDDNTATLSLTINGVTSAGAHGEKFSLSNGDGTDSALFCDSGAGGDGPKELSADAFDPASGALTFTVSRTHYYGTCYVDLWLVEAGSGPFTYGGTTSPKIETPAFRIESPSLLSGPQFSAGWTSGGVQVTCDSGCGGLFPLLTSGWKLTLSSGSDAPCGSSSNAPTTTIDASSCPVYDRPRDSWKVAISYNYAGQPQGPSTVPVDPAGAPTPVVATGDFNNTQWVGPYFDADGNAHITLTYSGAYTKAELDVYNWTEQFQTRPSDGSADWADCGQDRPDTWTPDRNASHDLAVNGSCLQGATDYRIKISSSNDPNQQDVSVPINGTVPTAPPPPPTSSTSPTSSSS